MLLRRNIIRFHGFGMRVPGDLKSGFYVMDLLQGGSLKGMYVKSANMLKAHQRCAAFSVQDAMRWACEITSAVAYMHDGPLTIIHRDLVRACLI